MREMNIAIAINDTFMMPATVMLHSLFRKTSQKVRLFLLYSSLAEANRRKIRKQTINAGFSFEEIMIDERLFEHASLNHNPLYSVEIFYRILLPYLTEVEKVLWLDSDLIVNKDIAELYNHDISDVYIAACTDIGEAAHRREEIKHQLGISGQVYFNSGVMLLNTEKIRKEIPQAVFFEAIERYNPVLRCPDQDILNLVLGKKMLCLETKYNDMHHLDAQESESSKDSIIIHFYWKKPWNTDYDGYLEAFFWREALDSGLVPEYCRFYAIKRFRQLTDIMQAVKRKMTR